MRTASPKGDLLLRIGAAVTVVGLACALVAMTPLVVPSVELPGVWWFLSMLTGVGLALMILGLLRSSRARRAVQIQKVQH
jgi:VIT1/CCC1 family predicted Fe2+/Mn2+ transporter